MRRTRRKQTGFTLIEMVVATVLLAVAIVSALSAFSSVTRATEQAERLHRATLLAQARMAELERQPSSLSSGSQQGEYGDEAPGFRWQETIEPGELKKLVRVTVTIFWGASANGSQRSLTTYLRTDAEDAQQNSQDSQNGQNGQNGQNPPGGNGGGGAGAGGGGNGP